jgi:hypothetical protein
MRSPGSSQFLRAEKTRLARWASFCLFFDAHQIDLKTRLGIVQSAIKERPRGIINNIERRRSRKNDPQTFIVPPLIVPKGFHASQKIIAVARKPLSFVKVKDNFARFYNG